MQSVTPTPVDSIEIPSEYVELAGQWYSGQGDLLYAVSSTGNLTMGNRRPHNCDTDPKWYLQLWRELSCDVGRAVRAASKYPTRGGKTRRHRDYRGLVLFESYVDEVCERLAVEYGLEDWDACDD